MATLVLLCGVAGFAQSDKKAADPQTSTETTISGKLIDASCYSSPKCRVGAGTKEFGLILPDKTFLKFDEGGNQKVLDTLTKSAKGKKLLNSKPGAAKRITVRAKGTRTSDTFNLESIQL